MEKHLAVSPRRAPSPTITSDRYLSWGRYPRVTHQHVHRPAWDDQLAEIGPRVPSSASPDHGAPFAEVFKRYDHDFYKIDRLLFSPAEVVFCNLRSGRSHAYGQVLPDVLARSFFGQA